MSSSSSAAAPRRRPVFLGGCWVPEVSLRQKVCASSVQGEAAPLRPRPKVRYAASALMLVWLDAAGTTKVMTCTGPKKSPTEAGFVTPGQLSANTSETPTSTLVPARSRSHVWSPDALGDQWVPVPLMVVLSTIAATPVHDPCDW